MHNAPHAGQLVNSTSPVSTRTDRLSCPTSATAKREVSTRQGRMNDPGLTPVLQSHNGLYGFREGDPVVYSTGDSFVSHALSLFPTPESSTSDGLSHKQKPQESIGHEQTARCAGDDRNQVDTRRWGGIKHNRAPEWTTPRRACTIKGFGEGLATVRCSR